LLTVTSKIGGILFYNTPLTVSEETTISPLPTVSSVICAPPIKVHVN
jgi:hypothetical protein